MVGTASDRVILFFAWQVEWLPPFAPAPKVPDYVESEPRSGKDGKMKGTMIVAFDLELSTIRDILQRDPLM